MIIEHMNLRGVDLNLLVVLQAVLQECHVSRAAERLGMSQPAVSNALDRARGLFGDTLLERRGREMELTVRGRQLLPTIDAALARVGEVFGDGGGEVLAEVERPVRVMLPEPLTAQLLSSLAKPLAERAPSVLPVIQRWQSGDAAAQALERGETDLAISGGTDSAPGPEITAEVLGSQLPVLALRHGHPAGETPSLEQWLSYPHVVVSTEGRHRTSLDDKLAEQGLSRRVGLVVPNFTLALDGVLNTDLIAQVPEGVARQYPGDIVTAPAPVEQGSLVLRLLRHRRSRGDVAIDFMAEQIAEAFAGKAP